LITPATAQAIVTAWRAEHQRQLSLSNLSYRNRKVSMEPTVTLITRRAGSADDLTEQDYREIYDELRSKCPLRQFAEAIHSQVSFAWWSKYERGEAHLTRARRAELRAAVGLPALPPAVADVLAGVDPDASVYQVGESSTICPPDRVILVEAEAHEPLTLRLNGDLQIVGMDGMDGMDKAVENGHVTGVTRTRRRVATKAIRLYPETWERLSALRREAGMSWEEFGGWVAELCGG
jgi:hypothetical protein